MIAAEHIGKSYCSREGAVDALRDVSLEAHGGELTVIVGPSGSGKSTLLGVLGGLITPSAGTVRLAGEDLWGASETERALKRAREIGFVLQSAPALRSLTVRENVELSARFAGLPPAPGRADELLDMVGMRDKALRRPWQLSGGEKRRLAIAGALFNRPSVVLADEPTGDLDPEAETAVMELFGRAAGAGAAVVVVTHNHGLAPLADRVFTMSRGRLLRSVPSAARQAAGQRR